MNIAFIEAKGEKLNEFANYRYLKKLAKAIALDVLHLHTSDSLTVFTLSDMLFSLRIKAVFSKKGIGTSSSFLSKIKYNYKNVASIICVSKYVENHFSPILSPKNKNKMIVLHDCIPLSITETEAPINLKEKYAIEKEHIIGNIANHTSAKDLLTFVNVADYLINHIGRKDVVFIQVGEYTRITNELQLYVKEKGLEKHIIFTGRINNAFGLNPQFDIFLLTSQREGGPTSALEAMLLGTPVISTKVGVIPDIINNGENGFIADVGDFKNLAIHIDVLLSDTELQYKFSENNKRKITNEFNSTVIARQILQEYIKILS
jgi:glycosyltransferase involved in cell wall biosynthesis